jgi:hypothetical protein
MFSRALGLAVVSSAVLGLCLAVFNVGEAGDKDKVVKNKDVVKDKDVKKDVVKDKDLKKDVVKEKEKDKKDKKEPAKVELQSVAGEITGFDVAKGTVTIGQAGSKSRTFIVNDDTKFVGPKGGSRGMGKAGLKDETLVKGAAVRVAFAQDDKVALEVHLPARVAKSTPPEKINPPTTTPPQLVPPQLVPPQSVPPQVVPQAEWSEPRIGPVRRLFRRIFRGD